MGVILPVMSLTLVLVIGISSLLVGMIGYIIFSLPSTGGGKTTYSFEFLGMISRSFSIANIISDVNIYDRTFLEQAIESMATGSTENGNANPMSISVFIDKYDMRFYSISIEKGGNEIFNTDNLPRKCGGNGICVPQYDDVENCGVGRIKIDDKETCKKSELCCEENEKAYTETKNSYTIVKCGIGGICTTGYHMETLTEAGIEYSESFCEPGRIPIEEKSNECHVANNGNTPLCCRPLTLITSASETGNLAQIPLLFRGINAPEPSFGYVNVITDDR
ncbi:MAG: hypothetical protein V1802_02415 [Candidatus Aenigmatarchaeota archaeon]